MTKDTFAQKLKQIVERFREEIASMRTSRVSSILVEGLIVDYYGSPTPLKAIATITHPEARTLAIQPWDKSTIPLIEKAIERSELGLRPVTDKDAIRIRVPPLTEERRRELAKLLGKQTEQTRIYVRQNREEAFRALDERVRRSEINKDEHFREKDALQKIVDAVNEEIEGLRTRKEEEIMAIS